MKTINDLPHNMCMCSYHADFTEAAAALHSVVPSIPDYENGFVNGFLCEVASIDCWFLKCENCSGISVSKLNDLVGETSLDSAASWMVWKKDTKTKRIEK